MSIQAIIRPLLAVATLTLAGSALAGPPSHPFPLPKQLAKVARSCEQRVPSRGYRDSHSRCDTYNEPAQRAVPAR